MWKLEYEAPVGMRIKKGSFWVIAEAKYKNLPSLWYVGGAGRFMNDEEYNNSPFKGKGFRSSDSRRINSVKAFERFLRKHCMGYKEYQFVLVSREYMKTKNGIIEFNVKAIWEE